MTLQETFVQQELANLDLSKVAALHQKRTLAFINHFVVTTTGFFNNFMKKCEDKLMRFERKIETVEAAMVLLEARLSSIPEAEINTLVTQTTEHEKVVSDHQEETEAQEKISEEESQNSSNTDAPVNPEYERFLKMVQVGVPLQAVKLKVSLEGLDPAVFENLVR